MLERTHPDGLMTPPPMAIANLLVRASPTGRKAPAGRGTAAAAGLVLAADQPSPPAAPSGTARWNSPVSGSRRRNSPLAMPKCAPCSCTCRARPESHAREGQQVGEAVSRPSRIRGEGDSRAPGSVGRLGLQLLGRPPDQRDPAADEVARRERRRVVGEGAHAAQRAWPSTTMCLHLQRLDGEFQRRRGAVILAAALEGRHEVGDVATTNSSPGWRRSITSGETRLSQQLKTRISVLRLGERLVAALLALEAVAEEGAVAVVSVWENIVGPPVCGSRGGRSNLPPQRSVALIIAPLGHHDARHPASSSRSASRRARRRRRSGHG